MEQRQWDSLLCNARIMPCVKDASIMTPAAIAIKGDAIAWVGAMHELPENAQGLASHVYDLQGKLVTPGLIDCHSHSVFAGNRANEFLQRLQGVSYADIAKQGGGIQATVKATRAVSEEVLLEQSLGRVRALQASGVTTLEIKSGYGLDFASERKMLKVATTIAKEVPITISKTFLGAHTIPLEYQHQPERYVDIVCQEMIPTLASEKLIDAVDVFCESVAFNLAQTERIFQVAIEHGLKIKCHADQLSRLGASSLAANYQALSVDHLEYANVDDIKAMAKAGTCAVLLPGAYYYLREKQLPPIQLLRDYQIPIAIASDCNPGTSPIVSLPIVMNMACVLFKLSLTEVWLGVSNVAARSLGISDRGQLAVGKKADMAIWSEHTPEAICYYLGAHNLFRLIKNGKDVQILAKS